MKRQRVASTTDNSSAIWAAIQQLGGSVEFDTTAPPPRNLVPIVEEIGHGRARLTLVDLDSLPQHLVMEVLNAMARAGRDPRVGIDFDADPRHYREGRYVGHHPQQITPFMVSREERERERYYRSRGHRIDDRSRRAWEHSMDEAARAEEDRRAVRVPKVSDEMVQRLADAAAKDRGKVVPVEVDEPTWTPPPVQKGNVGKVEAPKQLG